MLDDDNIAFDLELLHGTNRVLVARVGELERQLRLSWFGLGAFALALVALLAVTRPAVWVHGIHRPPQWWCDACDDCRADPYCDARPIWGE